MKPPVVVGIGASAGGLDALVRLLPSLPRQGMCFVLVQHLAADQGERFLSTLRGQVGRTVEMVTAGSAPEEGIVYLAPPHALVEIVDGRFQVSVRAAPPRPLLPIDFFFHALASGADGPGVGILLSGMGSDGVVGLREIKAAGGIVIVQDPTGAEHDTLPRAAIESGLADLVLEPEEMGAELGRLAARLPLRSLQPRFTGDDLVVEDGQLGRVFELLRGHSGVDFATYKPGTIRRRLQRRIVLNRLDTLARYVRLLEEDPAELRELYQDLLIHVTRFFRDPGSFEALRTRVFPRLLDERRNDDPIRIWIPGCSTGEEAYSVAIALLELLGERASSYAVQIFATDLSDSAVTVARAGIYPPGVTEQLSDERLQRFFSPIEGGFRVAKAVRDLCIFTRHDLTRDPPFSHLDLVLCRNVLIYLGATLQSRVLSILHYGLKVGGFLMLGSAESIGARSDLFRVVDKRHSLYEKRSGASLQQVALGRELSSGAAGHAARRTPLPAAGDLVTGLADRHLLDRYAPPAVIVDSNFNIVQARGQTGHFLELAPGEANLNVLRMAREGLLYALRTGLYQAQQSGDPVRRDGLLVRFDGEQVRVAVEVVPLGNGESRHFLVLFEETRKGDPPGEDASTEAAEGAASGPSEPDDRLRELQDELEGTRSYLQSMIQDLEAANEELQSANEEILSSNEELQSTNEELDTAREELQSTNEELHTLNEELHVRNEELARANSDLTNLLASLHVAVIMVDDELRIRRFTPMAERVLNVLPGDLGRPIAHLKPNFELPDLAQITRHVIDHTEPIERDVHDQNGQRFVLRARPYKGVDNRIEGAMVTLIDVEALRASEAVANEAQRFAAELLRLVPQAMALVGADLRVRSLNQAFARRLRLPLRRADGALLVEHLAVDGDLAGALAKQRRRQKRGRSAELRFRLAGGATLRVRPLPGDKAGGMLLMSIEEPASTE